ncbi:hypothetical protein PG994_012569 [Apiospora phragmitis]|uniref:Uncharacterized protein n=1 Tax=Apiospora phragmitis TaxID=2905665 RepID=A0ABR1TCL0_9PEZI
MPASSSNGPENLYNTLYLVLVRNILIAVLPLHTYSGPDAGRDARCTTLDARTTINAMQNMSEGTYPKATMLALEPNLFPNTAAQVVMTKKTKLWYRSLSCRWCAYKERQHPMTKHDPSTVSSPGKEDGCHRALAWTPDDTDSRLVDVTTDRRTHDKTFLAINNRGGAWNITEEPIDSTGTGAFDGRHWVSFPRGFVGVCAPRIPALLAVASIFAVEFERIRSRAPLFHELLQLAPTSTGRFSDRSGSPSLSPPGSFVFEYMGGGRELPPYRDCRSDISLQSEEMLEEEQAFNVEGNVNLDLEAAPGGRQRRL